MIDPGVVDLIIPHWFLDALSSLALMVASVTWRRHYSWRKRVDKKLNACVIGVNFLVAQSDTIQKVPDYVKKLMQEAIQESNG